MRLKVLKKNLLLKQLSFLFQNNEVIVFIHPTVNFNYLKHILYLNSLNHLRINTSLLRLFFCHEPFFKSIITSVNCLLFFKTFTDFIYFYISCLKDKQSHSFIILYTYWVLKRRFLPISYLTAISEFKSQIELFWIISFNIIDIIFLFFSFLNNMFFLFFKICLRLDS